MKKLLLTATFLLALLPSVLLFDGLAKAATMPWTLFSEQAKDVVNALQTNCGNNDVLVVIAEKEGHGYVSFYADKGKLYVVLYYPEAVEGTQPSEVGVGRLDEAKMDEIPSLKWAPMSDALNICDLLIEEKT